MECDGANGSTERSRALEWEYHGGSASTSSSRGD
jgi:hypothetical protein